MPRVSSSSSYLSFSFDLFAVIGIDKNALSEVPPTGFYSEDPTDILNSVLDLPIDLPSIQDYINSKKNAGRVDSEIGAYTVDPMTFTYKGEEHTNRVFTDIARSVSMERQLQTLTNLVPHTDICVFASMLGRPDKSMEITTHRSLHAVDLLTLG